MDNETAPAYVPPTHTVSCDKGKVVKSKQKVVPEAASGEPTSGTPAARASPFRNHTNFVAGQITIGDTAYQYGQLSDPLREWMEARPQFIADKLGISLGAFERDQYTPDTPENRAAIAQIPENRRPELAKSDEIKKLPIYFEETYNRVLEKCLVGCDYPGVDFERTPEMKFELAMEVKAALVTQISRSSKFGLSQSSFLRQGA